MMPHSTPPQGLVNSQDQLGYTLLEILIATPIVGFAVIGLALAFSAGQVYIVAQGDDRTALYLAQQKLGRLQAKGFQALQVNPSNPTLGCVSTWPSSVEPSEPCYDEKPIYFYKATLSGGAFTYNLVRAFPDYRRTTQVDCVDPSDFTTPLDPCPNPVLAKRIRVTITPDMTKARPVVVETGLTLH